MKSLIPLDKNTTNQDIGNKAASLKRLMKLEFELPKTYVIPGKVYKQFLKEPKKVLKDLLKELNANLDLSKHYAIRSSSNLEDSINRSFAGQFESFLNIRGESELLEKIQSVWKSSDAFEHNLYKDKEERAYMAVIVQEMIDAKWAGVVFSRNPLTGRPETIIEGVEGSGEQLVQKGITPQRWIIHNDQLEKDLKDPNPGEEILFNIYNDLLRLKQAVKGDVDVEWVFDGKKLFFIQWRPITVRDYPLIFSNHISRDVLPGMIKPLVWSVNIPLVNGAWMRILEKIMGKLPFQAEDLSRQFYYRTYFNMGSFGTIFKKLGLPTDSLENLMGRKKKSGKGAFRPSLKSLLYLPRILVFLLQVFFLELRFRRSVRLFEREFKSISELIERDAFASHFNKNFKLIDSLCQKIAYHNIIIPLYLNVSMAILQKKLKKNGLQMEDLDFQEDFPEIRDHDPTIAMESLKKQWKQLEQSSQEALLNNEEIPGTKRAVNFADELDFFLDSFGHFSQSGNDFSFPHWRENKKLVLEMISHQSRDTNPSKKSEEAPAIKKIRRSRIYQKAGKLRLFREIISSLYTKSYGLFRTLFLNLGREMQQQNKITEIEDIFYLDREQIERMMVGDPADNPQLFEIAKASVLSIKSEMKDLEDVSLPSEVYGEDPPPLIDTGIHKSYSGIAASKGTYNGEIVVIKNLNEMDKMKDKCILVIPFSDVGWTPLLSRAGAIVSESGGMLSHAAIIARELGIPAIVSVDHACKLPNYSKAIVDGQNGVLTLINKKAEDE